MISSILSCYILHCVCIRVSSHVCDRIPCICMFMYACECRSGAEVYAPRGGLEVCVRGADVERFASDVEVWRFFSAALRGAEVCLGAMWRGGLEVSTRLCVECLSAV